MATAREVRIASGKPMPARKRLLLLAALVTLVVWQLPFGAQVLYPFTLLATYAHEMGHGLAAMLVGADFESLAMYPDGSGLAMWRGDVGRLGRAFVAAGGLVGPSFAGALLLIGSSYIRRPSWMLYLVGFCMLASVALFARSWFAFVFVSAAAVLLLGVARLAPERGASFMVQLLAVQLCIAVFRDLDYMFSEGGMIGGVLHRSDTAAIAEALFLPYWVWGAMTAGIAFAFLGVGLWMAVRSTPTITLK